MDTKRSRNAAIDFLDYLEAKGLMALPTVRARKAAVNAVLGILSDQEAQDVTAIDLNEVMTRFQNLHGKKYTPKSLVTYKARTKSALDDFSCYVENPLAFKPSVQARQRKSGAERPSSSTKPAAPDTTTELPRHIPATVSGPMANSILPIPIRADLTVHIQGLPFDLTAAEAKKIASVVQAMAMPT